MDSIRIDKWLWAIRAFKTRSLATEACKGGRIKIDGIAAKASRDLKIGDIIEFKVNNLNKKIKVVKLIKNRVNATLAAQNYEDLTSAEEYERLEFIKQMKTEHRDRGAGRPSKRDRRNIEKLKNL
ncbi:MAG: RNA-binding S4 domain-containing protein [Bacteroidetes bacterium]|nr:MAG: RNA-binding S4 domain-containing protein [Bacteroidota bacterium]